MAQRVASLYAEIGADTRGLKRGLDETKGGLQGAKKGMMDFKTTAIASFAAIGGAILAAKKAYDFAKEGAQLEMVRGKFDNLTESIGTTSDALLRKLRSATRGTRSDMELVAAATDFMSLGLAKTEDQVLRLTRVSGALGMNMNQLVLTLTNQTTMRFDALGVAVDGFDDKLAKLKATGMDANAAFTEAFLQQAEEQIKRVGDVADTDAGKIMAMEAAFKNLGDTAKIAVAPALGELADQLVRVIRESQDFNAQIEYTPTYLRRFDNEILGLEKATSNWVDEGKRAISILDQQTSSAANAAASFDNHKKAIRIAARASEEAAPKFQSVVEILNADVASPIAAFRKDIQWWIAGGDKLNQAFMDIKEGVMSGAISKTEADTYLGELEIAAVDLNEELGNISAKEAAEQISEDFHVSFKEARQWLEGTEGPVQALEAFTSKAWYVDLYYRVHGQPEGVTTTTTDSGGGSRNDRRRQHGGPVSAGMPYLVGEQGPEIFMPSTSGRIIPNNQISSGSPVGDVIMNVYPSPGMDEYSLANYAALVMSQRARRSAIAGAGYVGH